MSSGDVYNVNIDGNNNDSNLILSSANGLISESLIIPIISSIHQLII